MGIKLRPYQREALDTIVNASVDEKNLLLAAATGAGKTIIFSELSKQFAQNYNLRVAILVHREILARQAAEKMRTIWPEAAVSVACSSLGRVDLSGKIVIGSYQTFARRKFKAFDVCIVDEVHRLAPQNQESQYKNVIDKMRQVYPEMRLLGVTATPYRLTHGYIYGKKHRPGAANWFNKCHYEIGINTLISDGFLVPYRAKEAEKIDLSGVGKKSTGDYNETDIETEMTKPIHLESIIHAYREHGEGRQHVVIFAVSIKHAEMINNMLVNNGYNTGIVHSKMSKPERADTLQKFDTGQLEFIVNVNVLTEGWDSTAVNLIMLCRPTLSAALYVQMVGRGLRLHEGKKDCLILDFSGNCSRHGDPSAPLVTWAGSKGDKEQGMPLKECPECGCFSPVVSRSCEYCGYEFSEEEETQVNAALAFKKLDWGPKAYTIQNYKIEDYISQRGNRMLKLTLICGENILNSITVNHFLDFNGASWYGLNKARGFWREYGSGEVPESVTEACERFRGAVTIPKKAIIKKDGKYWELVRFDNEHKSTNTVAM